MVKQGVTVEVFDGFQLVFVKHFKIHRSALRFSFFAVKMGFNARIRKSETCS